MAEYIENVTASTAKLDWAFPFQRTGSFPLDRSSVFSSYADAVLYATQGEDSRGLSKSSYVGQPISVYDEETASISFYVIDVDRSLKEMGSTPAVDGVSIEIIQDKLSLKDFGVGYYTFIPAGRDDEGNLIPSSYNYTEGFKEGLELRIIEVDGKYEVAWYEADNEILENLQTEIAELTKEVGKKADASNIYTKLETDQLIASAGHLKRKKIDNLNEIDLTAEDVEQYIYMVLVDTSVDGNDKYNEYMVLDGKLEKVGAWDINLDGYITEDELNTNLSNYASKESVEILTTGKVDKLDGYSLISVANVEKLDTISANAEPNFIKSVAVDFTVTEAGQLNLNQLSVEKVSNLQNLLDNKVDKKASTYNGVETDWILLSPENQAKLSALVVGDTGNIEISGKVNAENVEGLESWIVSNRETVLGLYPETDAVKLASIEANAQENYIKSVDSGFIVSEEGKLSLNSIPVGKIENLDSVLPAFTAVSNDFTITDIENVKTLTLTNSYVETSLYKAEVGDLTKLVKMAEEDGKVENSTIVDEINYINARLQWTDLG